MLDSRAVFDFLAGQGVSFYAGVPDSLLKEFCACVAELAEDHLIAANEGGAVALAAGHHLATGKTALVYMQNSGLGNAVNPLTSLADREVYAIPMLLLIGWRGEPGVRDEPQHRKKGRITPALLDALGIPRAILPAEPGEAERCLAEGLATARRESAPYAILVRKDSFAPYPGKPAARPGLELVREEALAAILPRLGPKEVVVSTTGVTSRELFELREKAKSGHGRDFLTVGSMGHGSQIALAIARARPELTVYCVDGDGAALMHLGGLAIAGASGAKNLRHILFNNGAHESVGGQPTAGFSVDFPAIAKACGYRSCAAVDSKAALEKAFGAFQKAPGPSFLEIRIKKGHRKDLGRPTSTPRENKDELMGHLRS